ncbi:hypothetical protein JZ751_025420 [Albula glossodonta]|uniref:TNFAIP3-interacting protein 1 n=1 Tax=Albula glossodonta TaxID=121402 RepID=A0A8T2MY76_9TELE|nr:hypothetical protein JZ751_025420 [Albula glossodonta]
MGTLNEMSQSGHPDPVVLTCGSSERCDSVELDAGLRIQVRGSQASHHALGPCTPLTRGRLSGQMTDSGVQVDPVFYRAKIVSALRVLMDSTGTTARLFEESPKPAAEINGPKSAFGDSVPAELHNRLTALERQRLELLEINKKWDEQYQSMKMHYEAKIKELRKRLAACDMQMCDEEEGGMKHRHLEEKLRQAERVTDMALKRNSVVCAELLEAERQAECLRLHNTTLTRRGQQQQSEIRRLNEVLSETLSSREREEEEVEETRTQLEVLKHQVRIYEEDFRKERAYRERAQERKVELERRVKKLHAELELLRSQVTGTTACGPKVRSPTCCDCCHGGTLIPRGEQAPHSTFPRAPRTPLSNQPHLVSEETP